ncbi:hypothetical protein K388_06722 [Streptomyces sp. KhCrAH-43]|uniref:Uncharacterized protein n=1 Tax=Streptomyces tropicalis TaxID=3034234 RepID=A0ABT6AE87_9ACTN|nr:MULTISPECIES: hypothetical protein [Streptomyces]MDF3302966.1 hypothetical protein [Streptomyces tropicalis]MYS33388.1 hypothetical protein [Streptomyces sp. SID4920]MYX64054.1 hypothetical protein [Streptomyces sp. SID8373]RAJ49804.1 hypothetical protein K388_06722 [Streptomyces sp. KhCrAH-43]
MHRVEARQIYTTCQGGPTSHFPETVVVRSYEAGARTAEVTDESGRDPRTFDIPVSYFHATNTTTAGRRRITGYYLTGTLRR